MRYFAYGSNMDPVQMAERCPGAPAVGPAVLPAHRLGFTWDSSAWGGGVATVLPDADAEVWGVLWEIGAEHERTLDSYEGVAYRKDHLIVRSAGDEVRAMIYIANETEHRPPSRRYLDALLRGARAHGLPDAYVARLAAVEVRGAR